MKEPENYKKQQRFFAKLNKTPNLEVILGRLEQRPNGSHVEKGVDVAIAVDMLSKAYTNQYDVVVLVSGDGDYARALQAVKDIGKKAEVAYFPKCHHLRKVADQFIDLSGSFLDGCWLS